MDGLLNAAQNGKPFVVRCAHEIRAPNQNRVLTPHEVGPGVTRMAALFALEFDLLELLGEILSEEVARPGLQTALRSCIIVRWRGFDGSGESFFRVCWPTMTASPSSFLERNHGRRRPFGSVRAIASFGRRVKRVSSLP